MATESCTNIFNSYAQRLEQALKKLVDTKNEIVFLRLQIKQEKKQEKWANGSPVIAQLKELFPELRIENGAGMSYLGLTFEVLDKAVLPAGWSLFDSEPQDRNQIGSPINEKYKYTGIPAMLYVTRKVR